MRDAETILAIIRDRGRRGLPLDDVYRQLYNPKLYLLAYGKIARNAGAMTPGVTTETVDGMSLAKIQGIIGQLRQERYRWTPVRRVYIEKKHSTKKRPLGVPTWSDKLVQEVVHLILEAYYEPQFSLASHGFRPERGCHTALDTIYREWTGTTWFIEGDIAQCFDRLDHAILMEILRERITDNRFLRLIENLLKAGYLEDWRYNATYSGTPQGGIVSPILANIYLDRLDQFVAQMLVPSYTRGTKRKNHLEYHNLQAHRARARAAGDRERVKALTKRLRHLPSQRPDDPEYRRLRYVRYADDFLLGFIGPRCEAEDIKQRLRTFLADTLNLELSEEKTLITHARTTPARFLGYHIRTIVANDYVAPRGSTRTKLRTRNGVIGLEVPRDVVQAKCQRYMHDGKAVHRSELQHESVYTIMTLYQGEFRGIVGYYQLAHNLSNRLDRLKWVMETSLTKTLAHKLKISVPQVYQRFRTTITTEDGPYKGLEVRIEREGKRPLVAQWGGIALKRRRGAILTDQPPRRHSPRNDVVMRLLAGTCELCGSTDRVSVHHIRHLKELNRQGGDKPEWVTAMIRHRRKTLVVCHQCHWDIHAGRYDGPQALRKQT